MGVEIGTAGLTSAYQRTNVTIVGVSVVMETGGYMLVGVTTMPQYLPLPLAKPSVEIEPNVETRDQDELAKGYRAMATENRQLAEEFLPLAFEEWPEWDE
jgi:hypothetical protein